MSCYPTIFFSDVDLMVGHCISYRFSFQKFKYTDSKMPTAPVKTSIGCLDFGRQCNFDQVSDFGRFWHA